MNQDLSSLYFFTKIQLDPRVIVIILVKFDKLSIKHVVDVTLVLVTPNIRMVNNRCHPNSPIPNGVLEGLPPRHIRQEKLLLLQECSDACRTGRKEASHSHGSSTSAERSAGGPQSNPLPTPWKEQNEQVTTDRHAPVGLFFVPFLAAASRNL